MSAGRISQGHTHTILNEAVTEAGQSVKRFITETDSILVSLFVESIAGDLDVVVTTFDDAGQELDVITFPTQSAPTVNLLLRKAGTTLSNVKVTTTYSDAVTYRVTVRAITSGSGDVSVKIAGADSATASQVDVTTSATLVIPAALTDRAGLVLKNNGSAAVYVGFTALQAASSTGYPLAPGEALGMDISAGVEIYAISSSGTQDLRVLEAGG